MMMSFAGLSFSVAAIVLVSAGCGASAASSPSAPPPSLSTTSASALAPHQSTTTTAASNSNGCTISFVDIRVKDVSENGPYEAIGTVDLSKPIENEPFALAERVRRRACLQGGEAVGILATESGTGTEYIVVRHRRPTKPTSGGGSSAASKNVKIDYFPNAK